MVDELQGAELLKEGWRAVDREGAERLLWKAPVGSYLFRKDHFASCLEEILANAKKAPIHCYTLAYLDSDHQVREKTVVEWKGQWLFYDDDPTLTGNFFASLETLLHSMGPALTQELGRKAL